MQQVSESGTEAHDIQIVTYKVHRREKSFGISTMPQSHHGVHARQRAEPASCLVKRTARSGKKRHNPTSARQCVVRGSSAIHTSCTADREEDAEPRNGIDHRAKNWVRIAKLLAGAMGGAVISYLSNRGIGASRNSE